MEVNFRNFKCKNLNILSEGDCFYKVIADESETRVSYIILRRVKGNLSKPWAQEGIIVLHWL